MKTKLVLTLIAAFFAASFTASAQVKKPISKAPFTITKPGNYYLTKDLVVPAPTGNAPSFAVLIDADNVTLDLNGRTVASTTAGAGTAILVKGSQSNIRVRNGTLTGFSNAIYLAGGNHYWVEDVVLAQTGHVGIWIAGSFAEVRRCTVRATGPGTTSVQGIRMEGSHGTVEDCIVSGFTRAQANTSVTGIFLASGGIRAQRNSIDSALNAAAGTTAIFSGGDCLLTENVVNGWATGLDLSNDVYRGNAAFNCTMKYNGGQDGGGNK